MIVISAVPRAHLSDADLAAFRGLSDAQRAVVGEFPHCVFLDVERLLDAESKVPGSWRRQLLFRAAIGDGVVVPSVEAAPVNVWSLDPLPRGFPKLEPGDFARDGVHLRHGHYHTIRCAVEEQVTLRSYPVRPRPHAGVSFSAPAPPQDSDGDHQMGGGDAGRDGGARDEGGAANRHADGGAANRLQLTAGGHEAIRLD